MISQVDFVYNGDSTVNERNCDDVLKIFKKYKIFKVKSTKIKIQSSCFPVKCFVVLSIKPDQDISKDEDFFFKFKENVLKKCNTWRSSAV